MKKILFIFCVSFGFSDFISAQSTGNNDSKIGNETDAPNLTSTHKKKAPYLELCGVSIFLNDVEIIVTDKLHNKTYSFPDNGDTLFLQKAREISIQNFKEKKDKDKER